MKAIKRITIKKLKDGDIFWWSPVDMEDLPPPFKKFPRSLLNRHLIGMDVWCSGADQIFIVDDSADICEGLLYINGGHEVYVTGDEEVVLLGHYSKLLASKDKMDERILKAKAKANGSSPI